MLTSGHNSHALTQILPKTSGSVDGAPKRFPPPFTFISHRGFIPKHSREYYTPWSVFQDGPLATIMPTS
jgi:hypothetical protein